MSAEAKGQGLEKVEASSGSKRKVLEELGVSKSAYYRWRARHRQGSLKGPSAFQARLGTICVLMRSL